MSVRGVITVTYQQALGLREAMRPLNTPHGPIDAVVLLLFHERVLLLLVRFESVMEQAPQPLALSRDECLLISQFLSMQDGDWAADVLKQSRRALYELKTGVLPAKAEDVAKLEWQVSPETREAEAEWVDEQVRELGELREDSSPGDIGTE